MRRHIAELNTLPKDPWATSFLVEVKLLKSVGWAECKAGWLLGLCGVREGSSNLTAVTGSPAPEAVCSRTSAQGGWLEHRETVTCASASTGKGQEPRGSHMLPQTFVLEHPLVATITDCLEAPKYPAQDHWVV